MYYQQFATTSVITILFLFILGTVCGELIINKVDRNIDLTSQTAKYTDKITFQNIGQNPEKVFLLAIEGDLGAHLAYLEITVSSLASHSFVIQCHSLYCNYNTAS